LRVVVTPWRPMDVRPNATARTYSFLEVERRYLTQKLVRPDEVGNRTGLTGSLSASNDHDSRIRQQSRSACLTGREAHRNGEVSDTARPRPDDAGMDRHGVDHGYFWIWLSWFLPLLEVVKSECRGHTLARRGYSLRHLAHHSGVFWQQYLPAFRTSSRSVGLRRINCQS
jgi:hypothetical protein